jgi:putative endonuclease
MSLVYVYIIHSMATGRYYIGSTEEWAKRLAEHNRGKVRSTKAYVPWETVLLEEYPNRTEARKRELQIKRFKSGDALRKLIEVSSLTPK